MSERRDGHYVSSAVVVVLPGRAAEVAQVIGGLGGAEICACNDHRLVVVMEASSSGELGELLTAIGNLDGVVAANLVFEHVEDLRGAEA